MPSYWFGILRVTIFITEIVLDFDPKSKKSVGLSLSWTQVNSASGQINVAYITGVLIECIVFPTLIDQFFCFRFGVVEFHGLAQFTGGVRVSGGRCDPFSMPFGVIFPSANKNKKSQWKRLLDINIMLLARVQLTLFQPGPCRGDRLCPPH